jgi:hypothetical protein
VEKLQQESALAVENLAAGLAAEQAVMVVAGAGSSSVSLRASP